MDLDEMLAHEGRSRTGLTAWLRALPLDTPTPLDLGVANVADDADGHRRASKKVATCAAQASLKVVLRKIDGKLWVARLSVGVAARLDARDPRRQPRLKG